MDLRHGVNAGVLAAAALFAGTAWAQMDAPRGQPPEGMRPMHHGFGGLQKQLNLDPQQEDLWKKARMAQREAFKSMRAKTAETRAKMRVEIDKPGVDLKQFAQYRDQLREQMRTQMEATRKQVRTAWFAVYDSLDAKQREQMRVAIRDGMDRMGGHRGGRRGPGGMQGERFGQLPGDPDQG
jgi:Spy/CpxP family protein refolding chaperone